jgi:hypothetical protein
MPTRKGGFFFGRKHTDFTQVYYCGQRVPKDWRKFPVPAPASSPSCRVEDPPKDWNAISSGGTASAAGECTKEGSGLVTVGSKPTASALCTSEASSAPAFNANSSGGTGASAQENCGLNATSSGGTAAAAMEVCNAEGEAPATSPATSPSKPTASALCTSEASSAPAYNANSSGGTGASAKENCGLNATSSGGTAAAAMEVCNAEGEAPATSPVSNQKYVQRGLQNSNASSSGGTAAAAQEDCSVEDEAPAQDLNAASSGGTVSAAGEYTKTGSSLVTVTVGSKAAASPLCKSEASSATAYNETECPGCVSLHSLPPLRQPPQHIHGNNIYSSDITGLLSRTR